MKKKSTQFRWLVTMLLLVTAMVMPKMAWAEIKPAPPSSGDGSSANPYQIGTPEELYWFAALVNGKLTDGTSQNTGACAVLVKDITVNTDLLNSLDNNGDPTGTVTIESWTPLGYYIDYSDNVYYSGTFDGQGHSIRGLYCKQPEKKLISFCGYMKSGTIKNLAIIDSYFEGQYNVGGIVASSYDGFIKNCLFSGTVKAPNMVGGICGLIQGNSTISDCFSNAKILVDNADYYGGICGGGQGSSTKLRNCVYNHSLYTGEAIKWISTAGTVEHVTSMTTEEIASGKATHWLNRYQFGDGSIGWHQNIDNGQKDAYPVLDNTHGVVYTSQPCPSSGTFSNTKPSSSEVQHSWGENDVCTQCGKTKDVFDMVEGFQEPSQVDGVYQISTAGELYWFTALVNGNGLLTDGTPPNNSANAVLTKDITVNKNVLDESGNLGEISDTRLDWIPVGNSDRPYTGTFNGQGHTISGLFIDKSEDYVGLFGYSEGNIKNTSVAASYIKGDEYVGGLCGLAKYATIENCHNSGVVSGVMCIGGLCGKNQHGIVQSCSNKGKVISTDGITGGIVGNSYGTVENCFNESTITSTATASRIGGICGQMTEKAPISNSYSVGTVNVTTETSYVGVICGELMRTGHTISNCYYLPLGDMNAVGGYEMQASESQVINVSSKTADEFKSGEVAYLLNNSKSDGTQAWYQNLAAEGGDAYPVLKSTGDNTVYKGYRHNETTLLYLNNQVHAHAYNSSASDEESGNHDMSYVLNENPYTWTDTGNKTNATAKCNFTCTVCNSELAKDMTVTSDNENPNKPVTCLEDGFNYYKATLTFNGNSYDASYEQNVPKLGHDMPGNASLNSELQIYQKGCKREGCRYADYYATSDGNVVANITESGFVANALTLEDAKKYDNQAVFTATNFTYTRTFSNTNWTTWYVPFELTLTEEICSKFAFSRINNVHQYDTDNEGNADKTVVESFRQTEGVTLKANYPYLVKALSENDLNMELNLTDVQPALAKAESIDCQSVDYKYVFTGTYNGEGESGASPYDPYTLYSDGTWQHYRSLEPMRHYLTIESRNATTSATAFMRSIQLSVIGDENATGIVKIYDEERRAKETYDLGGRRIPAGSQRNGFYIENGKVIYKK